MGQDLWPKLLAAQFQIFQAFSAAHASLTTIKPFKTRPALAGSVWIVGAAVSACLAGECPGHPVPGT